MSSTIDNGLTTFENDGRGGKLGVNTPNEPPVVLVFASDLESRVAIAHCLRLRFRTQGADTVAKALGQWRSTRPAMVLIDLVLDGGSGLEILVEIRRSSQVPIIVMTHDATPETCVLALRLGADDVMVKPFDMSVLEARIDAILRRSVVQAQSNTKIGCPDHVDIDIEGGPHQRGGAVGSLFVDVYVR